MKIIVFNAAYDYQGKNTVIGASNSSSVCTVKNGNEKNHQMKKERNTQLFAKCLALTINLIKTDNYF